MNQHLRAGAMTAGIMAVCVATSAFLHLVSTYVTADIMPTIVITLGTGVCIFVIYSIFLARIRYEDAIKSSVDQK